MKECKIGASIIYHPEYYVMHNRLPGVDNGETSKAGLYGGQFDETKGDKTFQDTARRELEEESGQQFAVEAFKPQGTFFVKSERDGEDILTEAEIFLLELPFNITHDLFRSSVPMDEKELRRAKALGQLTSVASEVLTKLKGI
jgi:ADP-ribose pyrophosphatase YjhB (NUDIX family)